MFGATSDSVLAVYSLKLPVVAFPFGHLVGTLTAKYTLAVGVKASMLSSNPGNRSRFLSDATQILVYYPDTVLSFYFRLLSASRINRDILFVPSHSTAPYRLLNCVSSPPKLSVLYASLQINNSSSDYPPLQTNNSLFSDTVTSFS